MGSSGFSTTLNRKFFGCFRFYYCGIVMPLWVLCRDNVYLLLFFYFELENLNIIYALDLRLEYYNSFNIIFYTIND